MHGGWVLLSVCTTLAEEAPPRGLPFESEGRGMLLKQTDVGAGLVPHFLKHGHLDSTITVHLQKLVVVTGAKTLRVGEKRVGDRSRLILGV